MEFRRFQAKRSERAIAGVQANDGDKVMLMPE
jgi:hypothetical protein